MEYILRTDDGLMVAKFSPKIAEKIFRQVDGFWRQYRCQSQEHKRCYQITENVKWGIVGEIEVFLYKDYIIIEEN